MTGTTADAVGAPAIEQQPLAPLAQTALTATDYWNDSCSIEELTYAIEHGAVGATSNPTIVGEVLRKEMPLWRERIGEIIAGHPTWTEDEIAWQLIEEMAVRASELLLPVFEREGGLKGRLSIQTNPKLYRDSGAPRRAGAAVRRARAQHAGQDPGHAGRHRRDRGGDRGRASASTPRSASRSRRRLPWPRRSSAGLARREAAGEDVSAMSPVCTIMVGRLDDWMQVLAKRDGIVVDPGRRALGGDRLLQAAPTACSASAGIALACSRPPTATTSTGRS